MQAAGIGLSILANKASDQLAKFKSGYPCHAPQTDPFYTRNADLKAVCFDKNNEQPPYRLPWEVIAPALVVAGGLGTALYRRISKARTKPLSPADASKAIELSISSSEFEFFDGIDTSAWPYIPRIRDFDCDVQKVHDAIQAYKEPNRTADGYKPDDDVIAVGEHLFNVSMCKGFDMKHRTLAIYGLQVCHHFFNLAFENDPGIAMPFQGTQIRAKYAYELLNYEADHFKKQRSLFKTGVAKLVATARAHVPLLGVLFTSLQISGNSCFDSVIEADKTVRELTEKFASITDRFTDDALQQWNEEMSEQETNTARKATGWLQFFTNRSKLLLDFVHSALQLYQGLLPRRPPLPAWFTELIKDQTTPSPPRSTQWEQQRRDAASSALPSHASQPQAAQKEPDHSSYSPVFDDPRREAAVMAATCSKSSTTPPTRRPLFELYGPPLPSPIGTHLYADRGLVLPAPVPFPSPYPVPVHAPYPVPVYVPPPPYPAVPWW